MCVWGLWTGFIRPQSYNEIILTMRPKVENRTEDI